MAAVTSDSRAASALVRCCCLHKRCGGCSPAAELTHHDQLPCCITGCCGIKPCLKHQIQSLVHVCSNAFSPQGKQHSDHQQMGHCCACVSMADLPHARASIVVIIAGKLHSYACASPNALCILSSTQCDLAQQLLLKASTMVPYTHHC